MGFGGGGWFCGRWRQVAGRACPAPTRAAMGKRDVAAGWRAAYMRPLQITGSLSLRGFGALGGAQRAPPASKAGPLVRLLAPQGQALLTTPVSLRSTVAPCSQPRTPSKQRQFSLQAFFCCQKKATSREAAAYCRACSAASSGGISCFLRLTTPGSLAISPSGSTWNASRMISSALWP